MNENNRPERRTRKKKPREKVTARVVISRTLIFSGLALMLFAAIYEAANYPWQVYFSNKESLNDVNALPDPTPPQFDPDAVAYTPPPVSSESDAPVEETAIPGDETYGDFAASANRKIKVNVLGFIKIPKLGISVNVVDAATQLHLLHGAGHVVGSPLPDHAGNVCIAGHRVTRAMHPFRHMELMEPGDLVFVKYKERTYTYETFDRFIIDADETWVLKDVENEPYCLTLITCHPVGSARQRMILRARLIDVDGQTPEAFFADKAAESPSSAPSSVPAAEEPSVLP